jgi:hypothetical protein
MMAYDEFTAKLVADNERLRSLLLAANNVLLDYIPQLEARGASLNYGRSVVRSINAALEGK